MTSETAAGAVQHPGGVMQRFGGLNRMRDYGIVASFVILFGVLAVWSPVFLAPTNMLNILDQWAPVGLIAVAATLVIITGNLDLSTGAVFAFSGVVAALTAQSAGPVVGVLTGVLVGVLCGTVNALLVTVGRINAFMATLATSIIVGGTATLAADAKLITVSDPAFSTLGSGSLFGLKYSVWCFAVFALVCGFVLARTRAGRAIYATGGNAEAATLSGIRVSWVRAATFVISGGAAALAGVIVASRVSTGQADAGGLTLTFQAITAVIIGGTSILGGQGAIWRTILGLGILAMIDNGFNLLGVDALYQTIFTGAIILAAVAVDAWARKSRQ